MVAEGREEGEMSDLIEFRLSKGVSHDKWRWGAEEEEHVLSRWVTVYQHSTSLEWIERDHAN